MNPKSGIKSTEFWLQLAAEALAFFLALDLVPETHIAVKIAAFAAAVLGRLGYIAKRSMLKSDAIKRDVAKLQSGN